VWERSAQRDLRRLDHQVAERIRAALERYARTGQGDVRRLSGADPPEWRLAVGDWRARFTFSPDRGTVLVLRVRHRREVYRRE
jgi:mRNA interferase RelE/StbE